MTAAKGEWYRVAFGDGEELTVKGEDVIDAAKRAKRKRAKVSDDQRRVLRVRKA